MRYSDFPFKIFYTHSYAYLAEAVARTYRLEVGTIERNTFPDGEHYYRITSDVLHCDTVLIGGTINDSETLELYDLACGLVKEGARKLILVIPYFGYSTMERTVKKGEIVTAKTRARLLSAIPSADYSNHCVMIDLHSEGIPHYFDKEMRTTHLYAKSLVIATARHLAGKNTFVLASTDAGRAKWVESLANDMGVPAAFVYKRRLSGAETQMTGINADVHNKTVIMYDDMIRTGGSLMAAARAYREAGAKNVYAIATHGIFPNESLTRIAQSKLIDRIFVTDTHPNAILNAKKDKTDFLSVVSVAELIANCIVSL